MQASALVEGRKRFIYLGDGKGDYCPSLRLNKEDYVMPRKKYPLWELIVDNPPEGALRASIHEWSDAEELEKVLLRLVNESVTADRGKVDNQLVSVDCKFRTTPPSSHEANLPNPLPVPH